MKNPPVFSTVSAAKRPFPAVTPHLNAWSRKMVTRVSADISRAWLATPDVVAAVVSIHKRR